MPPGVLDPLAQTIVDTPRDPRRDADHERPGGHVRPFGYDSARCHDTTGADVHSVEEDASHADQAVVLDGAAVQDGAVAHADARADARRQAAIHMDDRAVLQVARLADHDRVDVPTEHRPVPHTGARTQGHVSEHDRAWSDERRGIDVDYCLTGWNGHWTQASTGSPFFCAGFHRRFFATSSA